MQSALGCSTSSIVDEAPLFGSNLLALQNQHQQLQKTVRVRFTQ